MSELESLASEIGSLFVGVAKDIYGRFSQEDKAQLALYGQNVAALMLQLRTEVDPTRKARIVDNLKTYANAAQLMVARYELIAADGVEKAAAAGLNIAVAAIVKIIVAAL